jgi:beta-glucanase (GH16 family)
MKKHIFTSAIIACMLSANLMQAQSVPPIYLDDFESGDKGWSPVDNNWVDFAIVNNPQSDADNPSTKVMRVVRHAGTANYAGIILRDKQTVPFGTAIGKYRYGHVKVLKTTNGRVSMKLENNGDAGSFSAGLNYTPNGKWQDLVFDLGGAGSVPSYNDFFIMVDQTDPLNADCTVYLDDIWFEEDPNAGEAPDPELPGSFVLAWSDEFNGESYDATLWSPQIKGDGFGNNELQYYTGLPRNIYTENGDLVLKVYKEYYKGPDGQEREYTSGKIWGQGKKFFKYGRVEASYKLPHGKGTWPAIWMMPQSSVYGGWPNSGEIDIMEFVGYQPNLVHCTVHRGAGSGGNGSGSNMAINDQEYNVMRIDWEPGYIKWYSNDKLVHTYNNAYSGSSQWPFDQAFYIILNFAVGGDWGGQQGVDDSIWPQEFRIDYIRVYYKDPNAGVKTDDASPPVQIAQQRGKMQITSQTGRALQLNICDLQGKQIIRKTLTGGATVSTPTLPAGIYIVSASDNENTFTQKTVIK